MSASTSTFKLSFLFGAPPVDLNAEPHLYKRCALTVGASEALVAGLGVAPSFPAYETGAFLSDPPA